MSPEQVVQQISIKHHELPDEFIRQVFEICHKEVPKEAMVDLLLSITKQSFLVNGEDDDLNALKYHHKAFKQLKPAEWIIDSTVLIEIEDVFGSFENAIEWLRCPHTSLGGERPGDYCTRHINGSLKVAELLQAIKLNAE